MERIFFINRRMQKYRYLNTRDTAVLFEVNERTIRRDIEYMRDRIDAPIVYDHKQKGYIYSERYKILENMDEKMLILYSLIKGMLKSIKYLPIASDDILKNLSQTLSPEYSEL
jgi:DNA-binding transcriptional regulator YhcF (GntR family)